MKTLKYLFLSLAALAAVGCDQDHDYYTPSPDDVDVVFFNIDKVVTEYPGDATGDQTITITATRLSATASATVAIESQLGEGADGRFDIPSSVTFAAGEYEQTIDITVKNVEDFDKGVTYQAKVGVAAKESNNIKVSGSTSVAITVSCALEWVPVYKLKDNSKLLSKELTEADYVLGADGNPVPMTGTFYYNSFFSGDDPGLTLERALGTNMFRINNIFYGIDFTFTIHPEEKVTFQGGQYAAIYCDGQQWIGYNHSSYGPVYCADDFYMWGPDDFADFPCFWDGDDTFAFHLAYFVDAGLFSYDSLELYVFD